MKKEQNQGGGKDNRPKYAASEKHVIVTVLEIIGGVVLFAIAGFFFATGHIYTGSFITWIVCSLAYCVIAYHVVKRYHVSIKFLALVHRNF